MATPDGFSFYLISSLKDFFNKRQIFCRFFFSKKFTLPFHTYNLVEKFFRGDFSFTSDLKTLEILGIFLFVFTAETPKNVSALSALSGCEQQNTDVP